jgi:hypothetical protein
MFRKLTVIICLISFCPVAVGAQELAGIANSQVVADQQSGQPQPNLSLPAMSNPAAKLDAAENPLCSGAVNCTDAAKVEEPKKEKSSGITMKEWAEIHLGDNRWMWWAGAAAALVALHVFVFVGNKK